MSFGSVQNDIGHAPFVEVFLAARMTVGFGCSGRPQLTAMSPYCLTNQQSWDLAAQIIIEESKNESIHSHLHDKPLCLELSGMFDNHSKTHICLIWSQDCGDGRASLSYVRLFIYASTVGSVWSSQLGLWI